MPATCAIVNGVVMVLRKRLGEVAARLELVAAQEMEMHARVARGEIR